MSLLVVLVPLALLGVATVCDLRKREVPDWISVVILIWGITSAGLGLHEIGWIDVLLGVALGFGLGALVFYCGGLGGADVKLIAATGAVLGPVALLIVLFWMALAGGVLALIAAARGQRDYAYVPAIMAGYAAYLLWPVGLPQRLFS